jgi:hypothetical protein
MKKQILLCSVLISLVLNISSLAQETQKKYLSGTDKDHTVAWDFFCTKGMNSGKWTKIAVPSNWEFQGFGKYSYGYDNRKDSTRADEVGMYKHSFDVPKTWKTQRIFIVFEGSMTDTEVKINGKSVGETHQGGFCQFKYEISSFVKIGVNTLEVKVSKSSADKSVNRAEREGDFWAFGGIYRPVYIEIVPPIFIQQTAIDAQANGMFSVDVFTSKTTEKHRLEAQVQTLAGENVGAPFLATINPTEEKTTLKQHFQQVKLWNAETPNLYQVQLTLQDENGIIHRQKQRFGFRTMEVRKRDGIYVNGTKVVLKGSNRHTIVPQTGRTTSKEVSINDVKLMQEMNMNAVRMSHYPPDQHFLEVCDSLGLYVLDELTGWQARYDTLVGRKLVKELVLRDVNHPSILFWDNGNEGGWNRDLDKDFHLYDPQKRPIFHPWERFGGFDSKHYITYNYLANAVLYDNDIMMPTEFMHGLYDGGHGAGLEDFWDLMLKHPHCSGGFLWCFADEGIVRTDKNGIIDTYGNSAPDGLVGPHREKEASFYTVKEIWSPIRITKKFLPRTFDGKLAIENHYSFTNLSECKVEWKLVSFPKSADKSLTTLVNQVGKPKDWSVPAGETGYLQLDLPQNWNDSEALYLTITDPKGKEIFTWSWAIAKAESISQQLSSTSIETKEVGNILSLKSGKNNYEFDKNTGYLTKVVAQNSTISLSNGPTLAGVKLILKSFKHYTSAEGYKIEASFDGEGGGFFKSTWVFTDNNPVELHYEYSQKGEADFMGITFDYPESKVTGMKWVGRGPYRVWKNRIKGTQYGIWHKDYNNTITGEDFQYPEFKGYHAELKWVVVETKEGNFTVSTDDDNIFLQMLHPQKPIGATNDFTSPPFPTGSLGFLNGISPIGAKFNPAHLYGPQSQKNMMRNYTPTRGVLKFVF